MYRDIIIEGTPATEAHHSPPALPQEYATDRFDCIPKIALPNSKFLFYTRANSEVIERLKQDPKVKHQIIADSWSELFYSDYRYWDWVFDFEVLGYQVIEPGIKPQKVVYRKKLAQVEEDEEIIGVYVPGIFAGDSMPQFQVPRLDIEHYRKFQTKNPNELISLEDVSKELREYLLNKPEEIYNLSPRKFEELIASILKNLGWEVQLTSKTKDGGYDILGVNKLAGGINSHWIIECKRYSPNRKVGVEIVRSLCGVKDHMKMANAMIVTTSTFTKGAYDIKGSRWDLELKDYDKIFQWLKE